MRLAVVDVGSHTVRLEIADSGEAATLPVHTAKWRLRLARRVKADGHIPAGEVDRVCQAVAAARDEAQEWGAQEVFAVATAVVRAAPNRREVLDAVHDRSGVPLRVLSGKREAELAFLAARRWMGWQAGPLALVDIGGGSLEVAFGRTGLPDFAASAPLGAGLVTREFFAGQDPPRPRQIKAVRREVRRQLREPAARVRWEAPRTAVATSRTFEQLARLCGSAPKCEGPFVPRRLERGDLRRAVKQLASMPAAQRAKLPGISRARAEQSLAGAVVADVTMELLGLESVTICPWALREGVLLHRLESGDAAGWTPLERVGRGTEVGAGRHG
ncbi:Ppx/GppA family phosphatase [Streptomyces armeniacus]|uniref:Ppx/GppA family phosphatase n=1 Tax=Streptomyces armeniacus TaxID=83291 RepID=A0A345XVM2_9ACTN|nr:Ppx/GppA family phosphatase [Streptomyces armeniacus]AXK35688.1 Ppx/GppA family phosphatase [Streptomyces armeniacus]